MGGIENFERSLSDKQEIAIHAVGTFHNLFMLPEIKASMSNAILEGIFEVLSNTKKAADQKIIIQTLTCIAYQG